MTARQKRKKSSVPPLVNLRAILDAHGITRPQLTARTGLTPPTIRRALRGKEGVSRETAEKIARAVGAPAETLYADLAPEDLVRAARLPAVTAGRGYAYPETTAAARPAGGTGTPAAAQPEPGTDAGQPGEGETSGRKKRPGDREYVILHRDEYELLRGALARIGGRLEALEESVLELASRPIAEFDVTLTERTPQRRGGEKGERT